MDLTNLIRTCRAQAEVLMPETAAVSRRNALTLLWEPVATLPCRLQPRRSVTRADGALVGITLWKALVPHDADVQEGDQALINGHTYTITGADSGRSNAVLATIQMSRTP
ncbi:MAG: hypothetical protein NT029_08270 [Armatimonadetes bacterium]|nr:hypothetical protein [Armatimonadota bacterium]